MSGHPAPTLFLLVGLPGAGKTTLARRLEQEHSALRLTPDEWMRPLFGASESDNKRAVLEHDLLWSVAARALSLGVNVVLDYGFWSREERELYRERARALGVRAELHMLDVPLEELWRRLEERNRNLPPATFPVTREELLEWDGWFQRPDAAELARWAELG
ncbi:AAA family ATPase [Deinococcus carri]|uniref:AAA family ATPase n=1 Tax=Deinococcus carri TaxID=1211323 RepID=UPI0031ED70E2